MLPHVVRKVSIEPGLKATVAALVGLDLRVRLQVGLEAILEHEHCGTHRTHKGCGAWCVNLHNVVLAFCLGEEAMSAVLAQHRLLLQVLPLLVVQQRVAPSAAVVAFLARERLFAVNLTVHTQIDRPLEGHPAVLAEKVAFFFMNGFVAIEAVDISEGKIALVALVGTLIGVAAEVATEVGIAAYNHFATNIAGEFPRHLLKVVLALHVAIQQVA